MEQQIVFLLYPGNVCPSLLVLERYVVLGARVILVSATRRCLRDMLQGAAGRGTTDHGLRFRL